MSKIGFIGFGEVNTPVEVIIRKCKAAEEALKAEGNNTVRMAAYEDMRCVAGIGFPAPDKEQSSVSKTLVYSFPLEAVQDFDKIYHHSVKWLIE